LMPFKLVSCVIQKDVLCSRADEIDSTLTNNWKFETVQKVCEDPLDPQDGVDPDVCHGDEDLQA
jgi:hypothetical protein